MKILIYVITLLAALTGLFVIFKHVSSVESLDTERAPTVAAKIDVQNVTPSPPTSTAQSSSSGMSVFELVIRSGRLVSGPAVIRVREGDEVTLHIVADTADELHIHGYDLRAKTQPGVLVTFHFVARRTGRFAIELHHLDQEVGALEVYPR